MEKIVHGRKNGNSHCIICNISASEIDQIAVPYNDYLRILSLFNVPGTPIVSTRNMTTEIRIYVCKGCRQRLSDMENY